MKPDPLTAVNGLPTGLIATFTGFNAYSGDPDHTPANSDNKLVYGAANSPLTIAFNMPVQTPSFWITTGPFGTVGDTIVGSLSGQQQFTFTNLGPANRFVQVTLGADKWIDKLTFTSFQDSELDDLTVVVPEPGSATIIVFAFGAALYCRSARRFETPSV